MTVQIAHPGQSIGVVKACRIKIYYHFIVLPCFLLVPELVQLVQLAKLKTIKPTYLANVLVSYTKEILRQWPDSDPTRIKPGHIRHVFNALDTSEITKDNVIELLASVAQDSELKIEKKRGSGEDDVRKIIKDVISKNPQALKTPRPEKALMGLVMKEIRGKAPGSVVMKILAEELKSS